MDCSVLLCVVQSTSCRSLRRFKYGNGQIIIYAVWDGDAGVGQFELPPFYPFARHCHLNSNMVAMVAPVTPDTSGDARRPDDHSGPDTPASLNNAANVFGLARYGHFCSVASELIIESMDTLSDRSSSAAQKKAAVSNMRLLATKLAEVDSAMVSAAASSNRSIHSVKKAVAKLRNEEGREVVGDPSPRSRKKQKSDALAKVESFVVSSDAATGTPAVPASSSSSIPARRTSPRTSLIPAPTAASGIFSPREVVSILRSLPNEKSRTKAKQLMRENKWVQYWDKQANEMRVHQKRALNNFWAKWKDSIAPPPE